MKERVLASRLIQKMDNQAGYAKKIGLSYVMLMQGTSKENEKPVRKQENED